MVEVLRPSRQKQPSFLQSIVGGLVQGIPGALEQYSSIKKERGEKEAIGKVLPGYENVPPELQKIALADKLKGQNPKQMTSLQQSQQKLADARLAALEQNQKLFHGLMGNKQSEMQPREEGGQPQEGGFDISKVPTDKLKQIAAFSGQPGMEGTLGNMAKSEIDRRVKEKEESPEFQRNKILTQEQAKSDTKFYTDLNDRRGKQILKEDSLKRIRQINKKGVSGKVYEKVLDSLGLTAKTSEGRRELSAEIKNQFTDFKQIAGSQLSAAEFFVLAGAYPNSDFTQEANEAIINNLEQVHDTLNEEYKIAQRLKKENSGKLPENFQEKVNNELQGYVSNRIDKMKDNIKKIQNSQYGIPKGFTLMYDPNGDPMSVPEDKVTELLDQGASLP